MKGLLKSAGRTVLINAVMKNVLSARVKQRRGFKALAGLMGLIGLTFLFIAEYQWLGTLFAPETQSFLMGLSLIATAALIYLCAAIRVAIDQKQMEEATPDLEDVKNYISEFANDDLAEMIRDNPKTAVALSAAVGAAAGNRL